METKQYIGKKGIVLARTMKEACFFFDYLNINSERDANGYYVKQASGRDRWIEKDDFEEMFSPTVGMTYGWALEALKLGKKVARAGWNGKGMYLALLEEQDWSVSMSKIDYDGERTPPKRVPWIVIKTNKHSIGPYVAANCDQFADDWYIVEE